MSKLNTEAQDLPPPADWSPSVKFNMPAVVQKVDSRPSANPANFASYNDIITKAAKYIKDNEGSKPYLYKDTKGFWTIGIGHLVTTPEELLQYKGRTLTDAEIEQLFAKDISSKMRAINATFGATFNTFSDNLKCAIIDGYFRGDLSASPNTIQHLLNKNFKAASVEYLNNNEYRAAAKKRPGAGVAGRMEKNAAIMAAEPMPEPAKQ